MTYAYIAKRVGGNVQPFRSNCRILNIFFILHSKLVHIPLIPISSNNIPTNSIHKKCLLLINAVFHCALQGFDIKRSNHYKGTRGRCTRAVYHIKLALEKKVVSKPVLSNKNFSEKVFRGFVSHIF